MSFKKYGRDPDYRYSLANERTFLAWIRTALAILAGAILIKEFTNQVFLPAQVNFLSGFLALFAGFVGASAYVRWRRNEIAMRLDQSLPAPFLISIIAFTILALGMVLLLILLY